MILVLRKWSSICASAGCLLAAGCDEDGPSEGDKNSAEVSAENTVTHEESEADAGAADAERLDGGASDASGAVDGSTNNNEPRGLYWSYVTGQRLVVDFDGYPEYFPTFDYVFLYFGEHGYVHTGTPNPDVEAMKCRQPNVSVDAGTSGCQPYTIDGNQITIGTWKPQELTKHVQGGGWKIGTQGYYPAEPQVAGGTLNGSFKSIDCFGATCYTDIFGFNPDGTYWFVGRGLTAQAGTNFSNEGYVAAGGARSKEGRYTIQPYSITLEDAAGVKQTLFLFVTNNGNVVQIGGQHYNRSSS